MKLQTQLSIALVPVLLVAGGATTLLTRRAVHNVVLKSVARRGVARLTDIEPIAGLGIEARSESLLLPLITPLLAQEQALYAMALDKDGLVLAHTDVVEAGSTLADPASLAQIRSNSPVQQEALW